MFLHENIYFSEKTLKKHKNLYLKTPEKHDWAERIDSIWKIWEIFKNQNARTVFLHILPKADRQKTCLKK